MAEPVQSTEEEFDDITLKEWQALGQHLIHKGHRMFYRDEGQGEVMLCVHGLPGGSWDWHLMWPTLTAHYRVIAPDMIGHALSEKPIDYAYSVSDQADQIEELCDQLAVTQINLLGQGSGVAAILELLARQNEQAGRVPRIQSITLLNSSLLQAATETVTEGRMLMQHGAEMLRQLTPEYTGNILDTFRGPLSKLTKTEVENYWELLMRAGGVEVNGKLMHFILDRREQGERWLNALKDSQIPLHAVLGDADPVWAGQIMEYISSNLPHMAVAHLPEIGHFPQLEDPEGVLNAMSKLMPGW